MKKYSSFRSHTLFLRITSLSLHFKVMFLCIQTLAFINNNLNLTSVTVTNAYQIVYSIYGVFIQRGQNRSAIAARSDKHDYVLKLNFHRLVLFIDRPFNLKLIYTKVNKLKCHEFV